MREASRYETVEFTILAAVVALTVALILPIGFFGVGYQALRAELDTEANVRSALIRQLVVREPEAWHIEQHKLEGLLSTVPPLKPQQTNELRDETGKAILRMGQLPPAPIIEHVEIIHDQGASVAELHIKRSIRPLCLQTALVGVFGLILGIGVFVAFRVLPMRALRRTTEALEAKLEELEAARREAESASRAKSLFLASASHDLRQPLHALAMFAGVLEEQEDRPETRDLVFSIKDCVRALEELFSSIMDISKLDAQVVQPARSVVPVTTLLERLRTDFEQPALAKGLHLYVRPCRKAIYTDPLLLQRILNNFVANAVRYTEVGHVLVACRIRGPALRIEVRDTGPGIPDSERENIFEEFYQVGNEERDRSKGLGLGLAIVRRLGALLGHKIDVASVPGKGSCFWVDVPLDAHEFQPAVTEVKSGGERYVGKVLVVIDDEPAVREGMNMLLRRWGCDTVVSASLSDAREELDRRGVIPDAVIADYRLRGGEVGTDAIVALREEYGEQLPAAVITGDIGATTLEEFANKGLRHAHKPVPAAKLRELLDSLLAA